MNVVIADPKNGKAYSKKTEEVVFLNKKIGDEVTLDVIGMTGFKGKISGGSDKQGFPMKPTLEGSARKKIFAKGGVGFRPKKKGERKRINVRGNVVSPETSQLNLVLTVYGSGSLDKLIGKPEKKEEKKVSFKEKAVKESLEAAGEGDAEDAKKIKGKVKG